METVSFVVFMAIGIVFESLPHMHDKLSKSRIVQHVSKHHYLVWLFHPAVWHGAEVYVIHLVEIVVAVK